MTLEEKKELINSAETLEELEERKAEIEAEEVVEETTTEEEAPVEEEVKEEETEEIKEEQEEEITPEEERSLLKDTETLEKRSVQIVNTIENKGEMKMEEVRNSKEYVEAYADYVKGKKDAKELRALITTGGYATGNSATVEVPDMVYDIVKTAWEREDLIRRVRRISAAGNMKVQFEVSGDAAVIHTEGQSAVSEEELVLGVITITPQSIKKWISISDEALDMRSEEFLNYIYDELTYRIAKKLADTLVGKIKALPQSLSANDGVYDSVSAAKITAAPGLGVIAEAISNLSDEATDNVIVMNKLTYAEFKKAQYQGNFAVDPFEGLEVIFNNSLPAYSAASANGVYAFVGDLSNGALANFPNGEDIEIKYDDTTLMTSDLVRILGREYVGVEPIADKAFTLIAKPASV